MVRFVVLDDEFIGDEFIGQSSHTYNNTHFHPQCKNPLHQSKIGFLSPTAGQYTIPLECLQPGYRHVPLQCLTGEDLPHAKLFVHVALTNRRGGGKPHKRGLSVRKARRGREYTALRDMGIRSVDEVFKMAAPFLREATDLRSNMQVRTSYLGFLAFFSHVFQKGILITENAISSTKALLKTLNCVHFLPACLRADFIKHSGLTVEWQIQTKMNMQKLL